MNIQKFLKMHKPIKIAFYVLISIIMFFVVLGFLRNTIFGGVNMRVSNDSFLSGVSKSTSFNEGSMVSSGESWKSNEYNTNQGNTGKEDKKVIKTANLSLIVEDVEVTAANIKGIAESLGGSADNRNIYESGNNIKYGNVTVRVPSSNFDIAIQAIKKDVKKVTSENIISQDVTEEYVDLSAQLKNLKSIESQYVQVLQKAETIDDILKVRNVLDSTRGEIERLQGRMLYLERQVAMSTISISLVSEADVEVMGVIWSPVVKIEQAALRTLESVIVFVYTIINIIFFIPIVILWLGLIIGSTIIAWKSGIWLKKRFFEKN